MTLITVRQNLSNDDLVARFACVNSEICQRIHARPEWAAEHLKSDAAVPGSQVLTSVAFIKEGWSDDRYSASFGNRQLVSEFCSLQAEIVSRIMHCPDWVDQLIDGGINGRLYQRGIMLLSLSAVDPQMIANGW